MRGIGFLGAAFGAMLVLLSVPAGKAQAQAQEPRAVTFGRELYKEKANCQFCHRWDGAGDQGYGAIALSLRKTQLTKEQFIEVVKCGRPTTGMPYHERGAYDDKRCFDLTRADLGRDTPPGPNSYLNDREVEAVVEFIYTEFVGKPDATYEECQRFWGTSTRQCDSLKK